MPYTSENHELTEQTNQWLFTEYYKPEQLLFVGDCTLTLSEVYDKVNLQEA